MKLSIISSSRASRNKALDIPFPMCKSSHPREGPMTYDQLLAHVGGGGRGAQARVHEKTGIPLSTLANWKKRGYIPRLAQYDLNRRFPELPVSRKAKRVEAHA